MVKSAAKTPEEYLREQPEDRRKALTAVRKVILKNLPKGYQEAMNWGMITYEIPLSRYPLTYNKQPVAYAALGAQKNYMAVYLMGVYGENEASFKERYRATGKKLDMGKSCVRFKKLDDLPLELIGEVIRKTPVDAYIKQYEAARKKQATR